MLKDFSAIKTLALQHGACRRMGVVAAQDAHTLEAVARAVGLGAIEPILYGPREEIRRIWDETTEGAPAPEIVDIRDVDGCVAAAMADVRGGALEAIMKGRLETGTLMKAVVNREYGIRSAEYLSLVAVMESPYYHKVFAVTDVGLMTYPDLEQKAGALRNAVDVFHRLGVTEPKVGVLAAVEKVNPKMPDSVDAGKLKERFAGAAGCIVEGPISYDLCMDREAAGIKGFSSLVAGDADILLVPDIAAGNLLAKSLTCTGGAKTCGTVCGTQVPVVVTSRSATAEDKYMSIILAAAIGRA